ncbi:hypothetical protein BDR22DRAFT_818089 [Usnea florida]
MQTLWSRVVQVRRACNCPFCLPNTNAIARRATTATFLRTPRVGDVFTVSVSSLTAAIAFADSKKKDKRRNEWDKVIGEVRATVDATEIQQQSRLAALSSDAGLEPSDSTRVNGHSVLVEGAVKSEKSWDVQGNEERNKVTRAPDHRKDNWLDVFDWAQDQQRLREASGFQDWKGLSLGLLQSLSGKELNELLANDWLFRHFYGGPDCQRLVNAQYKRPLSPKKLKTLEWSVACMVLRLLVRCSDNPWETWEDSICPCKSLLRDLYEDREALPRHIAYIRERLRTLHADRRYRSYYEEFESPQAPNYDDTTIEDYKKTTEMNASLQKVLKLVDPKSDLSDLMSKLCYNLLASRTPPDVETYNMLLTRFCVLGRKDLVWVVYTSMLESHVRPNEVTHTTLLRHFAAIGKRRSFWQYLERMEGRQLGLGVSRPKKISHPMLKDRYLIVGTNRRKAVQKGRMNGQVYESLIVGLIRYHDSQAAMHYYRRMISEGWETRIGVWIAILQDCCHQLDWTVGTAVMEQLEKGNQGFNTLVFEWLLRLCQCCAQQKFFDQILRNGVRYGALPASMLALPDSAKTKDVAFLIEYAKGLRPRKASKALEEAAKTSSNIPHGTSPFLLENILYECHDEDALSYTIEQASKRWNARFALQKRLDTVSEEISRTVIHASQVLYASNLDHLSGVMFWLSRRAKKLETELEQIFKRFSFPALPTVCAAAASPSHRDPVPNEKAQRKLKLSLCLTYRLKIDRRTGPTESA